MVGSPGAGKTLIARALPGILPEMSIEESLDVTRIYSVADQLPAGTPLLRHRPFFLQYLNNYALTMIERNCFLDIYPGLDFLYRHNGKTCEAKQLKFSNCGRPVMWLNKTGTVANFYIITAIGSVWRCTYLVYGYKLPYTTMHCLIP